MTRTANPYEAAHRAEARKQENRRRVAEQCAEVMRGVGITASMARVGGLGAVTAEQKQSQDIFRAAVAAKAGCRKDYIPSDATWEMACGMIQQRDARMEVGCG